MDNIKDYLLNADVAFANRQYNEALTWYQKVLKETPDDLYALSRAGAIAVSLGKFEEALKYFGHAREIDPTNGDNAFNYGNACFFNKDNVGAFEAYVEAEKLGCSEDIMPRLYYQMALLCSMRQDVKSALVYFKKCEDADREGTISLTPDMISEKMKLYMLTQDYKNAAVTAAQLVAIQPTLFRNYMVYFSMLMANKDFDAADKVLEDAKDYAEISADDLITILLEKSALYTARAKEEPGRSEEYYEKAANILEKQINAAKLTPEQTVNILLSLSDIYLRTGKYEQSIKCLRFILNGGAPKKNETQARYAEMPDGLAPEEVEAMIQNDMERIQEKIYTGELSEDLGLYAEMEYDEYGNLIPVYDETLFSMLNDFDESYVDDSEEAERDSEGFELSTEVREKVYFTFLSCYLEMDDFASAEQYALALKDSENKYYSYYGLYTCTMISGKLKAGDWERKYAEAIAFFRNQSFTDHSDTMAVIFRGRLYAEQGKFEKAKELAFLLAEADQKSLLDYIESCKQ